MPRPDGSPCAQPVGADTPLPLCTRHLLIAHDWVVRDAGATDVLPSPCLACGSRVGIRYPSGWVCAVCEWRIGEVPDDGLAPVRVDVVYYLRLGDRVKIGTSGNPRQRLGVLPHDEVLAFERGDRVVEQRRHREFATSRLGTSEWFAADPALVEHARRIAGATDPWSSYARWRSEALALRMT